MSHSRTDNIVIFNVKRYVICTLTYIYSDFDSFEETKVKKKEDSQEICTYVYISFSVQLFPIYLYESSKNNFLERKKMKHRKGAIIRN